ncbi:hypothetical protein [Brevibacillus brevis]|uniref:hypothetical protein n=1 Tax=Brevibacillus brevis TaxID=1393 RepID=UPI0037CB3096
MNEQKETTAPTLVEETSKSNFDVAMNLYRQIEDKSISDIFEIGEYLKIIAVNKKA